VQGFQGFQPECGVSLESFVHRKAANGDPLLLFGPLPVTTGLPVWSAHETSHQVHLAIEQCRGRARLAILTANTINPDVPLANIVALHEAVRGHSPSNRLLRRDTGRIPDGRTKHVLSPS